MRNVAIQRLKVDLVQGDSLIKMAKGDPQSASALLDSFEHILTAFIEGALGTDSVHLTLSWRFHALRVCREAWQVWIGDLTGDEGFLLWSFFHSLSVLAFLEEREPDDQRDERVRRWIKALGYSNEDQVTKNHLSGQVAQILKRIDAELLEVFVMKEALEATWEDIATCLGSTVNKVRYRHMQARQELNRLFA